MWKIFVSVVFALSGTANALAFDGRQLGEAIEMAELSARLNGDGTPEMDTPNELPCACGLWKLDREGRAAQQGNKHFGFARYGNRWAAYKSTDPAELNTYVIVARGTIEDRDSMIQDALALTTQATKVFFRDTAGGDEGHFIGLADDDQAGVHIGFANGLADVLFHRPEPARHPCLKTGQTENQPGETANGGQPQGLLAFLQSLDSESKIYITGHSQGAAIATLLHAFLLHRNDTINQGYGLGQKHFKIYSYVFAQPKPGDWRFAMDFSHAVLGANDGGFAYVINSRWDWVPQSPLSIEWPSEFMGQLNDSYSGGSNDDAFKNLMTFIDNYSNLLKRVRYSLATTMAIFESNRDVLDDTRNKLKGYLHGLAAAGTSWFNSGPFQLPAFPDLRNEQLEIQDSGVFHGDLDMASLKGIAEPGESGKKFQPGASVNYTPVGTLISLPLADKAVLRDRLNYNPATPASGPDITLQHHLWVYLRGLDKMKGDYNLSQITRPHKCDESSRSSQGH